MRDFLKRVFAPDPAPRAAPRAAGDIRIATCALFLELASIDNEFSEEERQNILSVMQHEFDLSKEHAVELAEQAVEELKGSVDVWQFTNLINENYDDNEKMRVVELLWRLVYADGRLDAHEDYLMHKLGKLLRMQHRQLIDAKLRAIHGPGKE